jgi:hypothetical protein
MKRIKPELIGSIINYQSRNGVTFLLTINQNEIAFYEKIGLNIFEEVKKANVVEEKTEVKNVTKKTRK